MRGLSPFCYAAGLQALGKERERGDEGLKTENPENRGSVPFFPFVPSPSPHFILRQYELGVLLGNEQQNASHKAHKNQRAYAKCHGVWPFALVDSPSAHGHGNHPGKRDKHPSGCHS